ncbi:MAG: hypothetical protein JJU00_19970 [Opitutales bacterium]|nr:hypothetical protein [Opitutales bacterium]
MMIILGPLPADVGKPPVGQPIRKGAPAPPAPWLLATGVWNDNGRWYDTETWNDGD